MSGKPRIRVTVICVLVVLVAALVAPASALAVLGGGPYSESISNTEDNGVIDANPGGGTGSIGTSGNLTLTLPEGAVLAPATITADVYRVSGRRTADGGTLKTVMVMGPDGFTFEKNITLSYPAPSGVANPRWFGYNPGTDSWVALASKGNGGKVTTEVQHFSLYGVGGDPVSVSSVPASSPWSLALLSVAALAALVVVPLVRRGACIAEG